MKVFNPLSAQNCTNTPTECDNIIYLMKCLHHSGRPDFTVAAGWRELGSIMLNERNVNKHKHEPWCERINLQKEQQIKIFRRVCNFPAAFDVFPPQHTAVQPQAPLNSSLLTDKDAAQPVWRIYFFFQTDFLFLFLMQPWVQEKQ